MSQGDGHIILGVASRTRRQNVLGPDFNKAEMGGDV